jgi:hypothetical protein
LSPTGRGTAVLTARWTWGPTSGKLKTASQNTGNYAADTRSIKRGVFLAAKLPAAATAFHGLQIGSVIFFIRPEAFQNF